MPNSSRANGRDRRCGAWALLRGGRSLRWRRLWSLAYAASRRFRRPSATIRRDRFPPQAADATRRLKRSTCAGLHLRSLSVAPRRVLRPGPAPLAGVAKIPRASPEPISLDAQARMACGRSLSMHRSNSVSAKPRPVGCLIIARGVRLAAFVASASSRPRLKSSTLSGGPSGDAATRTGSLGPPERNPPNRPLVRLGTPPFDRESNPALKSKKELHALQTAQTRLANQNGATGPKLPVKTFRLGRNQSRRVGERSRSEKVFNVTFARTYMDEAGTFTTPTVRS